MKEIRIPGKPVDARKKEKEKQKKEEEENKILENNQLIRPISSSLTYKVEELVRLFRKE